MNLYRNFGSMLETWVVTTDSEHSGKDVDSAECGHPTSSTNEERTEGQVTQEVVGVILRSESEDSGVETENAPSTPGSLHSGFSPVREMEARNLGGARRDERSPPLRSFSCLSLSALDKRDLASPCVRVEQALWRAAKSGHRIPTRTGPSPLSLTPPLSRPDPGRRMTPRTRCHSMSIPSGLAQRSGGPAVRRAPSTTSQQIPELPERCNFPKDPLPKSLQPSQSISETDSYSRCEEGILPLGKGLSPGLGYLEQVCKMLEEIARLHLRNQELQRENERVQNSQCMPGCQVPFSGQHRSVLPENSDDVSQSLDDNESEDLSSHPSHEDRPLSPHVRQRSMSYPWERIRGDMERQERSSWRNTQMWDEIDSHMPSAQKHQGKTTSAVKLKTDLLRQSKKIGLLFKKKAKTTSTS